MRPLLHAACGFVVLAAALAHADQRVTLVIRMGEPAYGKEFDAAAKKDPKFRAEFKRDMDADPMTALMMGEPVTLSLWVGADHERLDMGPYSFISSHHPDHVVGLDRTHKTIQTMPLDADQGSDKDASSKILDTKRTRTIAGHLTHEYSVEGKGPDGKMHRMRMWLAPDVPSIPIATNPMYAQMTPAQRAAFAALKGAVLRSEMEVDSGEGKPTVFSMQVVEIKTLPIPAGTFDIPAEFKKV